MTFDSNTITSVTLGVFTLVMLFDRALRGRRREADDLDKDIIGKLQTKVGLQEDRIKDLENDHKSNLEKLGKLTGENSIMRELLQGRDKQTVEFQRASLESMKQTGQIYGMMTSLNDSFLTLSKSLEKHFAAIEKFAQMESDKKGGQKENI